MSKEKQIIEAFHYGHSLRSIATRLSVSRNTINKVLNKAVEKNLTYEKQLSMDEKDVHDFLFSEEHQEIKYEMPDFEYIHKEMARVGVTVKLLWEEYVQMCKDQGKPFYHYTFFRELYNKFLKKNNYRARLTFKPGQRVFLDYNGKRMSYVNPVTGVEKRVYLFVGTLPFSGYTYVEATDTMKEHDWINSHIRMFEYFGGTVDLFVCDNLKTGVISHKKGEEIVLNKAYKELADYYQAEILPARVRHPQDKGAVENAVQKTTEQIVARLRNEKFTSLAEVNRAIRQLLDVFNKRPFQQKDGSRYSVFIEQEKPFLKPLPKYKYEYATWKIATVQPSSHIAVDYMYYSVPNELLKQDVSVRISQAKLDIFHQGKLITSHTRLYGRKGQYSTYNEHLDPNHRAYAEWNKDRFIKWAKSIGEATYTVIYKLFESVANEELAYRGCFSIFRLSSDYSKSRLENACKHALKVCDCPKYKDLKTILKTGADLYGTQDINNPNKSCDEFLFLRGSDYYETDINDVSDEPNDDASDEAPKAKDEKNPKNKPNGEDDNGTENICY